MIDLKIYCFLFLNQIILIKIMTRQLKANYMESKHVTCNNDKKKRERKKKRQERRKERVTRKESERTTHFPVCFSQAAAMFGHCGTCQCQRSKVGVLSRALACVSLSPPEYIMEAALSKQHYSPGNQSLCCKHS